MSPDCKFTATLMSGADGRVPQKEAMEELEKWWKGGNYHATILACCGSGKTMKGIFAAVSILHKKALLLSHRREILNYWDETIRGEHSLLSQTATTPGARIGYVRTCASVGNIATQSIRMTFQVRQKRCETKDVDFILASCQTIIRRNIDFSDVGLVIFDEAHLAAADTFYQR